MLTQTLNRFRRLLLGGMVAAALLASVTSASAQTYIFSDLGTLGGNYSQPGGINSLGQVAGTAFTPGDAIQHAVVWSGGAVIDLGTVGNVSSASGINNLGQVVGATYPGSVPRATFWNGTTTVYLNTLGGSSAGATGINNSGQIVGTADVAGNTGYRAVIWNGITPTDLGTLGGRNSAASAINSAGQIIGIADVTGSASFHAVVWNGTTPTDLGTLGGSYSYAVGINDVGQIVGNSYTTGNTAYHATIWNGTTISDLGGLGAGYSYANGINNLGQIVGASYLNPSALRATLWNGTSITDLNSVLVPGTMGADWELQTATGINDNGQITGVTRNTISGVTHAFLLTPVPEPETYGMLMAGMCLIGLVLSRRKPV